MIKKSLITMLLSAYAAMAPVSHATEITDDVVRIGVLADLSGPFSNLSGPGAVEAVRMAVEDFGGTVLGKPIDIIFADHHNKPDVASATAREWFDTRGVDLVTDLAGSASALAVIKVAAEKNGIAIINSASASNIAGKDCTPNSILYVIDTNAIARTMGTTVVNRGLSNWFFISADYAFGKALENDIGNFVRDNGGKVIGSVRHPINSVDFSSFVLQAQSSGADVVALATTGGDVVNALKSASEFGVGRGGKPMIVGTLINISDIHAVGLESAQGMVLTTPFYWNQSEESRKFARRFYDRVGQMPHMQHAGNYSSTLHYLKAIQETGTDDAAKVIRKMKDEPVNDLFAKNGRIREDGLHVHDLHLVQVKTPAESSEPWDYYKILQTIPGEQAFRADSESECALPKQ